jgi:hypothetical protein
MLEFRILGPLQAPDDGHEIAIKARQRGMLWMDSSRLESPRDPHGCAEGASPVVSIRRFG